MLAHPIAESEAHEYRLEILRTVYGHAPAASLKCRSYRILEVGQPQILALVTAWHAGVSPYEVKYVAPASELKAHEALARARLDYHAASAMAVFVGRDQPQPNSIAEPNHEGARELGRRFQTRRVVVDESLGGLPLASGQALQVELLGITRNSHDKASREGAEIYFATEREDADSDEPARWHIDHRLPAEVRGAVVEALQRAAQHPVFPRVDVAKPKSSQTTSTQDSSNASGTGTASSGASEKRSSGSVTTHREVLFAGTLAQALDLLTSASEPAVLLGNRRLLHERAAAIPLVLERLDRRLLEQPPADIAVSEKLENYRTHARLCRILAELEDRRVDGEAGRRVRRLLDAIREGQLPAPPGVAPSQTSSPFQANHSLRWLIESLDAEAVARTFGADLTTLAHQAHPGWQSELRELLETTGVERYVEWQAAAARAKDLTPIRSRAALWHDGRYLVAYSPSGKRFLTIGSGAARLWDASRWTLVADWNCAGEIEAVQFSPDEQFVWIAGERDEEGLIEQRNVLTGEVTKQLSSERLPVDAMTLSADGRRLVTSSDEEQRLHVWDTANGSLLHKIELEDASARFVLHPLGRFLLREIRAESWQGEELEVAPKTSLRRATRLPVRTATYNGDGTVLYALEHAAGDAVAGDDSDNPTAEGVGYVVSARRGQGDFAWLPQRSAPLAGNELRLAAGGKRLAVLAPRETQWTFTLLDLPSLRTVSRCQLPQSALAGHSESWTLSPDGRVLAVALEGEPPALFNTDTGERFTPGLGHRSRIVDLEFSPDGRLITTRDEEGGECEWNAGNLRITRRLPGLEEGRGGTPRAVQEGPYSEDGRTVYRLQVDARGRQLTVLTTDIATGRQRKVGTTTWPWIPDGPRGLVPGGKLLHWGTVILDRESLRPISSKPLPGWNIQRITFQPDGRRYAVAAHRLGEATEEEGEQDEYVMTIHETETGKLLAVLPTTAQEVTAMAFSPQGDRLVLVFEDNELRDWPVPDSPRPAR
ncbi:MAG: WD40 repeat domain-containing protein [Pirellulales bacterium]